MAVLTWGPWIGAPTPDGVASIKAKVDAPTSLRIATDSGMTTGLRTLGPVTPNAQGIVEFNPTGLAASTSYWCDLTVGGVLNSGEQGRFRTAPAAMTPANFKLAFSSCSGGAGAPPAYSNHVIFDYIRQADPDLFLHLGDLHYADPSVADPAAFYSAYDSAFSQSYMKQLLRQVPWGYMYSDHDAGPNGADRTAVTREAAREAFRNYVPHPPLLMPNANTDNTVPPYHEMTWGRVRIFMPDSRLEMDPTVGTTVEPSTRSRWGAAQFAYLKSRLLAARENLLIINVESPWIAAPRAPDDHWGAYTYERQEFSRWLVKQGLHKRVLMIEGDGHFMAMDDGRNNYAESRIPVINASPLDRGGMLYSGPYSQGQILNPAGSGHYVVLTVTDTGGRFLSYTARGYRVDP